MFGSRNVVGAAIIPATAPRTAASPQPSASIQPTRTPSSRLAPGFTADARIASPSVVNRKNSQSTSTVARQTQNVPMSCTEIVTPATSTVLFGNGLSKALTSAPQIQPVRPLIAISSPIVTITIAISGRFSTGRVTTRSIAIPPENAINSVSANAGQYDMPWSISDHAMYVVNVAISPCAKLTTSVAR